MKRSYSKPDIYYEEFSLSTNIAAGCEEKPSNSTDYCGVKFGKSFIFTSAIYGCTSIIPDGSMIGNLVDGENNGLCYHNPSADYNVFHS